MVGTAGGKVIILSSDNLTKQGQLENGQVVGSIILCIHCCLFNKIYIFHQIVASAVAIATETCTDYRYIYVAHENGLIKAWNGQLSAPLA